MLSSGYKIRNPEGIYFVTFATVEWVDVFTRKLYADIVVESLQYCIEHKGLQVHGWCLMSNHLHLILSAEEGFSVSDILCDFKKFTSAQIIRAIDENKTESRRGWMLWLFREAGKHNPKNVHYQFWRQNNQPKGLETNAFMDEKLQYVHHNPVEAGYVSKPEDWMYSSARSYAGEIGLLPIVFLE